MNAFVARLEDAALSCQADMARVSAVCTVCPTVVLIPGPSCRRTALRRRVPIEASGTDDDGMSISAYLHVDDGRLVELEMIRDDGRAIERLPLPDDLIFHGLPAPPGR